MFCCTVNCMLWECGEAHKVELTVVDIGWKIVSRVDSLMSDQPCTYLTLGVAFSLALTLLPLVYRLYHAKDQLENLDLHDLEGLHAATQLALGHNWRSVHVCCLALLVNSHSRLLMSNFDTFCLLLVF